MGYGDEDGGAVILSFRQSLECRLAAAQDQIAAVTRELLQERADYRAYREAAEAEFDRIRLEELAIRRELAVELAGVRRRLVRVRWACWLMDRGGEVLGFAGLLLAWWWAWVAHLAGAGWRGARRLAKAADRDAAVVAVLGLAVVLLAGALALMV